MKVVTILCRVLLGLGFLLSGINMLHPLGKMPPMDPAAPATQWSMLMMSSGWMKVVGLTQLFGGLFVLIGGTLPLGLCLLGPMIVNILCFHVFFTGGHGIMGGVICTVLWAELLYAYRGSFGGILTVKATPTS